jgi:hypothetical protein
MSERRSLRRIVVAAVALAGLTGLTAGLAPAAVAAPGDWTQLSQTSSAHRFPEIGNIVQPYAARFGGSLQVVWAQASSGLSADYLTAIVDAGGHVTTPATPIVTGWQALTENPSLISVGGQRFLSFSGLNPDRSGAQYFATSGDGTSWAVSSGSMSANQSAYAAYGSDVVDDAGTPVWVGNPGSTTGLTWHVGTSPTSPAPAGSDQTYLLQGCCAYAAAAARDAATGAVYAAFYSNSSATTENGIQLGQILPAPGPFAQAPGSLVVTDGAPNSLGPDQRVAMAARAGGGVYLAYLTGYPSAKTVRILKAGTSQTMDIPVSGNVRNVSMGADPAGRIWVAWNQDNRLRAVHTNRAATVLGSVGVWGAPRGTSSMWHTAVAGSEGGADAVVTATTSSAINVWHVQLSRTLTVKASPAAARRGSSVTFTVTDAGDPVAGARVTFAGRSGSSNASGKVTLRAPGSSGHPKAIAKKAGFNAGATSVRVR